MLQRPLESIVNIVVEDGVVHLGRVSVTDVEQFDGQYRHHFCAGHVLRFDIADKISFSTEAYGQR
jgi:hypothetical protein